MAFRRAGTLHWAGSDHLGGTIRVMDSSFAAVDGMRYEPYGEDRDSGDSLNTDRKFTGQTEDQSIGLYWYASRAYDPETGRFCTPDPIAPTPGNPQALNRYSYVYNNPLKYVDPSGHSPDWFDKAWLDEFKHKHKRDPNESDINYRYESMKAASKAASHGQDFSVKRWEKKYWIPNPYGYEQLGDIVRGPSYKSFLYYTAGGEATALSEAMFPGADDRSEKNAFKHAYWSALMTVISGPELAKEITDRHERRGTEQGQEPIDLAMDVINNEIGREIGKQGIFGIIPHTWLFAPIPVREYLAHLTALAIEQGRLVEIRDGHLVATDNKW